MRKLAILLLLYARVALAQPIQFHKLPAVPDPDISFRGLSVVDDDITWVSGTPGYVGITTNGGTYWTFRQVPGFEKCDFRTIYAFDGKTAVIANAGVPAVILLTHDSGKTWSTVYRNDDTSVFIDGADFWDPREGILYGDPLKGHMMVLRTHDGGLTWHEMPPDSCPQLAEGEASFAASGTNIKCMPDGRVVIATGGKVSRLWVSDDRGINWKTIPTPILQGTPTAGIFSFDFRDRQNGVIVGGDYKRDTLKERHVFYTHDGGKTWSAPTAPTGGYRECVTYITPDTLIATGPTGTDLSFDNGKTWQLLTGVSGFHTVKKARKGRRIFMTGIGSISTAEF